MCSRTTTHLKKKKEGKTILSLSSCHAEEPAAVAPAYRSLWWKGHVRSEAIQIHPVKTVTLTLGQPDRGYWGDVGKCHLDKLHFDIHKKFIF